MINKIKDEIQKSILVKSDIIKNAKLLSEIENLTNEILKSKYFRYLIKKSKTTADLPCPI